MTTAQDQNLEKQIQKQMGCMAGFFQLFDRQQILTGKRLYSPKRLPPTKSQVSDAQGSEKSTPAVSGEMVMPAQPVKQPQVITPSTPERTKQQSIPELRSPEVPPPKSPLTLPILELKEGTRTMWKFSKEAPRLSLDSRATVDSKGSLHPRDIRTNASILTANRSDNAGDGDEKQRRSTSVIARLMGLESLPAGSESETTPKKAELRRSTSESRLSRDVFQYRFVENNNFQLKQQQLNQQIDDENKISYPNLRPIESMENYSYRKGNAKAEQQPKALNRGGYGSSAAWKSQQRRRSFFDTADVFPEPKQTMSVYGDIEKRLKVRGIDHESSADLETLKQILEALQLKGLLHSRRPCTEQRNFVYDRSFSSDESPVVVMKPSKSPLNRRLRADSPPSRAGIRRNLNENLPSVSPRRERPAFDRNARSPTISRSSSSPSRNDGNQIKRSNNSIVKPKPLNIDTQRRGNEPMESRRVSPLQSPKLGSRRIDQSVTNSSPRTRRSEIYQKEKITTLVLEDESSSISESTSSTPSQPDTERSKMEEYREGKSLLERCDKLLNSIAEMTAANEMQPSPVSVLDSSFYKEDDSSSPSPVMKRSIDFKDVTYADHSGEFEDEACSTMVMSLPSKLYEISDDCDFEYISEILRASHYLPEDSDIFLLLEKQQYLKGKDTSKTSTLQRKLIFDIIIEILERNRQLPPRKAFSGTDVIIAKPFVQKIWSEFQKIREREAADDLFEIICGVLKKDLAGDAINGWGDYPVELSETVLDLERLIFKDLIGETIRDLATFACKSTVLVAPRRKLVF